MYKYDDILNLNELYTNDIHQVASIYGIEAAARVLIKVCLGTVMLAHSLTHSLTQLTLSLTVRF